MIPENFTGNFTIYDIAGKEILNRSMHNINGSVLISVSEFDAGIYIASLSDGNSTVNSKLVIR